MEYFKEKLFPELFKVFLSIFSSLFLLWAGSFLKKSSEGKGDSLFSFSLSPFLNSVLYVIYFFLFVYFGWKIIKGFIAISFSYIDHLQQDYIAPPSRNLKIRVDQYYTYRNHGSFVFRVKYGNISQYAPDFLMGISNPKCPREGCGTDLSVRRSYLGFYKYHCPACSSKYRSNYSQETLKAEMKSIVLSENEKFEDNPPY